MDRVTKRQAEKVLSAVRQQNRAYIEGGTEPKLVMDWDWFGDGPVPSIVWEEGPHEWTFLFPHGGIEEEFGFTVKDVSGQIPEAVFVETATHYAISLYPA